ncbi:phosphatidylglycerol:prolipoprotein diacylglycerol transferase [Luteibacter rhizovicinus]|uniref:Phosphatidylglycerol--prolipoprotein diacylglyceryl transferase n=1 Tax=Luteibacter rhizovicinus TaxID=242606 RepID=A0A4R3YUE2_9GAMM|nr:prolipoprotein diacylglyceryl transferase [Luteibacter rhizovicinus]TCV94974.1 phosphatidylglycerol:prolipoprotein diacylglycerol transferase [Luteibacter rhizovicinus]
MATPYVVSLDPVAFSLGPVQVHWYGLMYLLGFLGAWGLGEYRRRQGRLPVTADAFGDLCFYAMMGVVVGGRVGYMLFYTSISWIWTDPLAIFRIWDGGMSFHGGLLGVLVAGLWWSRRHRVHFMDTVDFVAPVVPIGLGLGRLGNFINGELWGKPTDMAIGMIFPHAPDALPRHPSQLYEFALEGVVMFTVLWLYSAKPRHRYAVSGLFALLYGSFRFLVEFVRLPDPQLGYLAFGWVTMGQILSLPLIVVGLVLLAMSRRAPYAPLAAAAAPQS